MRTRSGFTLVEMLIVGLLMTIIVAAVAVIFAGATNLVENTEARHEVTQAGRTAFDILSMDLYGALAWNTGTQKFLMRNGIINASDGTITYQAPGTETGPHANGAADRLIFRANTTFGNVPGTYEVIYELEPDPEDAAKKTLLTGRYVYALMRRGRVPTATQSVSSNWSGVPPLSGGAPVAHPVPSTTYTVPAGDPPAGIYTGHVDNAALCCGEVARYVLSFNLEYGANNLNFSQIQNPNPHPFSDPLGNGAGANDTPPPGGNPYRIGFIRATMIVVDERGERAQRVLSRVVAIPAG